MSDQITITPDGFLWYRGAKLQCRLVEGGLEFHEKDPRRAAACGGPLLVVPWQALLALARGGEPSKELSK